MNAQALIETLSASGVHLWAENNLLKVDAPSGVLTAEMTDQLKKCKAEMIHLLSSRNSAACPECGGAVLSESGSGWQHRWCPQPQHFDEWRSLNGKGLADAGAPIFVQSRQARLARIEERACVLEFEGGLSRDEAPQQAEREFFSEEEGAND